jgi:hypothetical protein
VRLKPHPFKAGMIKAAFDQAGIRLKRADKAGIDQGWHLTKARIRTKLASEQSSHLNKTGI